MTFNEKNILLISPEPWDHIFISKHHYAVHLSKMGANVVFANPPKSKWQLKKTDYARLMVLDYPRFLKGLRKYPSMISSRIMKKKFSLIEQFCEIKFDLIWSFDNSLFFDFTLLKNTFNISHIVDLDQNFELERASKTADLCLYVTTDIGNELIKHNPKSHFINHGYSSHKQTKPVQLPGKNATKFVYAGNLNMRKIDWLTLFKASQTYTDVDFIFLGPLDKTIKDRNSTVLHREKMLNLDNVYTLGRVPSDELHNYYEAADAMLLCYQEVFHQDQANSHKMLEYLASGRPVICTWTATYSDLTNNNILLMKKKNADFIKSIDSFLNDKTFYNSEELVLARKEIALDNTYDKQIERITRLIIH